MKPNELLADLVLYFHFLYVLGVIVPMPLIVVGARLDWKWVRVPWWRRVHVGMILWVLIEALIGMICPLTELESALRAKGTSENPYPEGFLAAWVSKVLFSDFAPWVYSLLYLVTAWVLVDLYILVPPTNSKNETS